MPDFPPHANSDVRLPSTAGLDARLVEAIDQQERQWAAGCPIAVEQLLADLTDCDDRLELVYNELILRERAGDAPALLEYQQRFPDLAEALRIQWEVDREVVAGLATGAACGPYPSTGRYEIHEELGRGSSGIVYRAVDLRLKRVVALKCLRLGSDAHPQELLRLRTEAESIAQLTHEHIVQVYDVGETSEGPYFALEYCRGGSLAARLGGQPLEPTEAARLVQHLAEAVAAAHARQIVHRDLKPANVLLAVAETLDPKITDFGLAKWLDVDSSLTATGAVVGTPAYMAPEQADGGIAAIGPAVDIYALGAILYECLTGRPPFQGATIVDTLAQVRLQEPVGVRRLQARVPLDLETITLQCLQKEPSKRYARACDLADELKRFLEGRPILARHIGNLERLRRWSARNPLVASLLGLVFGLLLVVVLVQAVGNVRLTDALNAAHIAQREARLREAEALVGEAHGIRQSRREGQRFAALAALQRAAEIGRELGQPAEWFDRLRNEAIAALALPDLHIARQWPGWPAGTVDGTISANGQVYARADSQGAVSIRRIHDDRELAQIPAGGTPLRVWLSHDGQDLARLYSDDGEKDLCQIWHLGTAGPEARTRARQVHEMIFLEQAEGRLAVFAHRDGSLSVHSLTSGAQLARFEADLLTERVRIAGHPTAPLVAAYSYFHQGIVVRNVRSGEVVCRETPPWPGGSTCAWHPGGKYLCVCKSDGDESRIYEFRASEKGLSYLRSIPYGHGETSLTFNPSGDRFFITGWKPTVAMLDFWTGRQLFETTSHSRTRELSRHGSELALASVPEQNELIGVWRVGDSREYRSIVPFGKEQTSRAEVFALHPSGRMAAQHFPDGIRLFDLHTGLEMAFLAHKQSYGNAGLHFDAAGALYTNDYTGMFRWPMSKDATNEFWKLGPPQSLPFHPGDRGVSTSRDGKVIAQAMFSGYGMAAWRGGWILPRDSDIPRRVDEGSSFSSASVSPDGRWAAFAGPPGPAKVFDVESGTLAFNGSGGYSPRFSTDGAWLLGGSDTGRAYAVGSWKEGPDLGPGYMWHCTSDNSIAVLGLNHGVYRLVHMPTGRELARLEAPDQHNGLAQFSVDDTQLIVHATNGMRVWDLRRLRAELAQLGLDWSGAAYPPAATTNPMPDRAVFVDR